MMQPPWSSSIISDLVMAYILARFVVHYGATTLGDGVLIGFMAWLGFVVTIMVGGIFYEKKPMELVPSTPATSSSACR